MVHRLKRSRIVDSRLRGNDVRRGLRSRNEAEKGCFFQFCAAYRAEWGRLSTKNRTVRSSIGIDSGVFFCYI